MSSRRGDTLMRMAGQDYLTLFMAAIDDLASIKDSLLKLVAATLDRPRNAYAEGATSGGGPIPVAGTTNPVQVVAANPNRRGLLVLNTSASGGPALTLGLGQTQPTPGSGVVLLAGGGVWYGTIGNVVWRGSVYAITTAAAGTYSFVEV